eukprot:762431-Hanusia_phi.AAC.5
MHSRYAFHMRPRKGLSRSRSRREQEQEEGEIEPQQHQQTCWILQTNEHGDLQHRSGPSPPIATFLIPWRNTGSSARPAAS